MRPETNVTYDGTTYTIHEDVKLTDDKEILIAARSASGDPAMLTYKTADEIPPVDTPISLTDIKQGRSPHLLVLGGPDQKQLALFELEDVETK